MAGLSEADCQSPSPSGGSTPTQGSAAKGVGKQKGVGETWSSVNPESGDKGLPESSLAYRENQNDPLG